MLRRRTPCVQALCAISLVHWAVAARNSTSELAADAIRDTRAALAVDVNGVTVAARPHSVAASSFQSLSESVEQRGAELIHNGGPIMVQMQGQPPVVANEAQDPLAEALQAAAAMKGNGRASSDSGPSMGDSPQSVTVKQTSGTTFSRGLPNSPARTDTEVVQVVSTTVTNKRCEGCPFLDFGGLYLPAGRDGVQKAPMLNGIYLPTVEVVNGRMAYKKEDSDDIWLCYVAKTGRWEVQPAMLNGRAIRGLNEGSWLVAVGQNRAAPNPEMVTEWRLFVNKAWIPQPLGILRRKGPAPLQMSGVETLDAADLNSWYAPVMESFGRRPIFLSSSGMVRLEFSQDCALQGRGNGQGCWAAQTKGLDGRAVNRLLSAGLTGSSQHPVGSTEWMLLDGNGVSKLQTNLDIQVPPENPGPLATLRTMLEARAQGLFGGLDTSVLDKLLEGSWYMPMEGGRRVGLDEPLGRVAVREFFTGSSVMSATGALAKEAAESPGASSGELRNQLLALLGQGDGGDDTAPATADADPSNTGQFYVLNLSPEQ